MPPVSAGAGYTVTIFLVDVSPTMGTYRTLHLSPHPNEDPPTKQVTYLQWSLQFAMLKIQEMIFNGRKTDQCGVILFGTDETNNIINRKDGGYDHVTEFLQIGQPNADTLAKLASLRASTSNVPGDVAIDALIVGIETLSNYLATKRSWTGRLVLLTDGESPIEIVDWEAIAKRLNSFNYRLSIIGVDFDDDEIDFHEKGKSHVKHENESFYHKFAAEVANSVMGTLSFALQEVTRPEVKQTRSTLMATVLHLGDPANNPLESVEIIVKTSKCTALARPKSWKRFAPREGKSADEMDVDSAPTKHDDGDGNVNKVIWAQLRMRTEFHVEHDVQGDDGDGDEDGLDVDRVKKGGAKVEKEQLVRGFKYGSSYVPCPDGQFQRLSTRKGISICGFFNADNFRREHSIGEVHYVWADPRSPSQQVALSSLVKAMDKLDMYAITRWVTKDGSDPKMGVLAPCRFRKVDCFLWVQMPFADDVRKYTFSPLQNLSNRRGEKVTSHPYLPTHEQIGAMDRFVDAMNLMEAGEKDEDGNRSPWYDTRVSYNPAIHRMKQALFHNAVVQDLVADQLLPPHPELIKYFNLPKQVLKDAKEATDECKTIFAIKKGAKRLILPKRVPRPRKNDHARAQDDDDEILLDRVAPSILENRSYSRTEASYSQMQPQMNPMPVKPTIPRLTEDDSETESESDDDAWPPSSSKGAKLPTPSPEPGMFADPQRAPGRIIGMATPLADFKHNISQGDVISKAVEDLGWVVKEVVLRPFAERRHMEMIECLHELREVCLQEDEIDAWNSILRELKECTKEAGNPAFWGEVQKHEVDLGLIAASEAARHGGRSNISDSWAEKVSLSVRGKLLY
ncbi:SPOC domain-like protein [Multifurca ochricompacta]|uniref:ATP-dependent DNA helicase II subunit 2 n=1 Tax=Multifurca ochricompacta TaxID=376703 RepID=A0AAD4MCD0_9AGAM|nr:SPOC domain-like protein [Multifurca ochricompacta]